MEDEAALMAIASYGAMSRPNPGREAFQIVGKTLKIMNKRLLKMDEPLINAVAHMWILEVFIFFLHVTRILAECSVIVLVQIGNGWNSHDSVLPKQGNGTRKPSNVW
jgi:hypothetical protein